MSSTLYHGGILPDGPGAPLRSEFQLQPLTNILRRRSRLIAAVAITGTLLACAGGLLIPPQYTAKAQIVYEPEAVGSGNGKEMIVQTDDQGAIQTQVTALTSRAHLQHVLDNIAKDPAVHAAAPQARNEGLGITDVLWLTLGAQLRGWVGHLIAAGEQHGQSAKQPKEQSVEQFERHLNVYQERGSHVIAIAVKSANPADAARGANRVAELHYNGQYQQKRENTNRTLAWLDGRIGELKEEVERTEAAVQQYRIDHSLAEANRTDTVDAKIANLNRQLTDAEADLAGRQARLNFIREMQHRNTSVDLLAQMLDSVTIRALLQQDVTLRQSLAEMTATLGERHPSTLKIVAQMQGTQRKLAAEVMRASQALDDDAKIAATKVRSLQDQLGVVQNAGSKAQKDEVRLHELERRTTASRQLYANLLQRREQLREQAEMIAPDVRVLSLAAVPDRPSSPNPILFIVPALVISAIIGGVLAVLLERLDYGLRSTRDITAALGIPCLGLVPQVRLRGGARPHLQLRGKPFAAYTEAIRSLAAQLNLTGHQTGPKVILVSSSVPKEGKTTLAVSVAVYAAQLGKRAILLDLDFRHPAALRELGANAGDGVFDLLDQDQVAFSTAAVQSIPGLGLDFLPVHYGADDPLVPFVGGQLPRLIRRLRASYDCIVIDGPPLLAVTEARLLAALADKILFAVRWGSTRREIAQNALNLLLALRVTGEPSSVDTIGAVVTQVDLQKHARYRYGDVGESFVRFRRYYIEGSRRRVGRHLPRLRSAAGGGQ